MARMNGPIAITPNSGRKRATATSTAKKQEVVELTAINIIAGIIALIDENGNIAYYRQRGIQRIDEPTRRMLMQSGFLNPQWASYKELPRNIRIAFEDESIQGKARVTFPVNIIQKLNTMRK